jgi:hypothetical protein
VNCEWCNVTSCPHLRTIIMEVIWNNKDCVYRMPVQHLSIWAIVHNRIDCKINFYLAPINISLNINSWNMFLKCIVCSFTPLNFQNECVPCSLLQQQLLLSLCISQLLPWLERTLWYILNCMQLHREKSIGFRLIDQFGHSTGPCFPAHIP